MTKEERKEYAKQWRKAHLEEKREQNKQYRKDHLEEVREQKKQWCKDNSQKVKEYTKQWNKDNPEYRKEYKSQWYETHKEEVKEYSKQYYKQYGKDHKEELKEYMKQYNQTLAGKEIHKRHDAKRRKLGFIPLNEWFEGSEGHHCDKDIVIHIPKELHKSVYHNVWTGQGMKEINKFALNFLHNLSTGYPQALIPRHTT